ncbi:hypothetical protein SRHO_G00326370 [Serrasalmus rhombeus]
MGESLPSQQGQPGCLVLRCKKEGELTVSRAGGVLRFCLLGARSARLLDCNTIDFGWVAGSADIFPQRALRLADVRPSFRFATITEGEEEEGAREEGEEGEGVQGTVKLVRLSASAGGASLASRAQRGSPWRSLARHAARTNLQPNNARAKRSSLSPSAVEARAPGRSGLVTALSSAGNARAVLGPFPPPPSLFARAPVDMRRARDLLKQT